MKEEGEFILATFDPNTNNYIDKLRNTKGITQVEETDTKGLRIELEKELVIIDIRKSKTKVMEYDIIVKRVKLDCPTPIRVYTEL